MKPIIFTLLITISFLYSKELENPDYTKCSNSSFVVYNDANVFGDKTNFTGDITCKTIINNITYTSIYSYKAGGVYLKTYYSDYSDRYYKNKEVIYEVYYKKHSKCAVKIVTHNVDDSWTVIPYQSTYSDECQYNGMATYWNDKEMYMCLYYDMNNEYNHKIDYWDKKMVKKHCRTPTEFETPTIPKYVDGKFKYIWFPK